MGCSVWLFCTILLRLLEMSAAVLLYSECVQHVPHYELMFLLSQEKQEASVWSSQCWAVVVYTTQRDV